MVVMPNNLSLSRWGFVVSKAVGSAVVRNAVKRRLRAAAQQLLSEVGGVDVVIRADARAPGLSVGDWVSAIRSIVTRHDS